MQACTLAVTAGPGVVGFLLGAEQIFAQLSKRQSLASLAAIPGLLDFSVLHLNEILRRHGYLNRVEKQWIYLRKVVMGMAE